MLEDYIKEIVKEEIAKDNLNKQYGKNSQSTYKLFGDYFNHLTFLTSSNNIRDLLYKVCEDKRINYCLYFYFFKDDVAICSISSHKFLHTKIGKLADELEIKLNRFIITKKTGGIDIEKQKLKQENERLKKENEILERSYNFISNNTLPDLESRVTSKERIATEINLMLNKEKRKVEELEQENEKLKNSLKGAKNKILELSSKDFTTNDIHIVQLEDANSKIETIGNMVEKLINENQKSEEKLTKISNVISLYNTNDITFMSLMSTINNIRNILKES